MEVNAERLLIERIEKLERRLAELEAKLNADSTALNDAYRFQSENRHRKAALAAFADKRN